jgi:hypothetical protein
MFTGAELKNIAAVIEPNAALKDVEKPPAKNEGEVSLLAKWQKLASPL